MVNTIIFAIALLFSLLSFYDMIVKIANAALQGGKKNITPLLPILCFISWVVFYYYSK